MGPKEMKLPDLEQVEFLSKAFLGKEWRTDPVPPFLWWKIKDDILVSVLKTKMRYRAELTRLEAQAKEIEAKMFAEIAKNLGR